MYLVEKRNNILDNLSSAVLNKFLDEYQKAIESKISERCKLPKISYPKNRINQNFGEESFFISVRIFGGYNRTWTNMLKAELENILKSDANLSIEYSYDSTKRTSSIDSLGIEFEITDAFRNRFFKEANREVDSSKSNVLSNELDVSYRTSYYDEPDYNIPDESDLNETYDEILETLKKTLPEGKSFSNKHIKNLKENDESFDDYLKKKLEAAADAEIEAGRDRFKDMICDYLRLSATEREKVINSVDQHTELDIFEDEDEDEKFDIYEYKDKEYVAGAGNIAVYLANTLTYELVNNNTLEKIPDKDFLINDCLDDHMLELLFSSKMRYYASNPQTKHKAIAMQTCKDLSSKIKFLEADGHFLEDLYEYNVVNWIDYYMDLIYNYDISDLTGGECTIDEFNGNLILIIEGDTWHTTQLQ